MLYAEFTCMPSEGKVIGFTRSKKDLCRVGNRLSSKQAPDIGSSDAIDGVISKEKTSLYLR